MANGNWRRRALSHFSQLAVHSQSFVKDYCVFCESIRHISYQILYSTHALVLALFPLIHGLTVNLMLHPQLLLQLTLQFTVLLLVLPHLLLLCISFHGVVARFVIFLARLHFQPGHYADVVAIGVFMHFWVLSYLGQLIGLGRILPWLLSLLSPHADLWQVLQRLLIPHLLLILSSSEPALPLLLLRLPFEPFDHVSIALVALVILRVFVSHVRLEPIRLPARLVVGDLSSPHLQVQMIPVFCVSLHLRRIVGRRSGVGPSRKQVAIICRHGHWLDMRLVPVKAVLVFVLSETHNKLIIIITIITIITCPSRRSLSLGQGKT